MQKIQTENIRNQGDSSATGATVSRLEAQLNGQKNDYELMVTQKGELEKVIKS